MSELSFINEEARYERKFVIEDESADSIYNRIRLHPANFREIFHERFVNNIYFDTMHMDHYKANVIGADHRLKVRIRWYQEQDQLIEKAKLEIKIKKGLLGNKRTYELPAFKLSDVHKYSDIEHLIGKTDVPAEITHLMESLKPVLVNRYSRRYFMSFDKKFRFTVDDHLEYMEYSNRDGEFYNRNSEPDKRILEIKYHTAYNAEATRVTNVLPYRLSKNSKYVSGVDRLGLLRSEEKIFT